MVRVLKTLNVKSPVASRGSSRNRTRVLCAFHINRNLSSRLLENCQCDEKHQPHTATYSVPTNSTFTTFRIRGGRIIVKPSDFQSTKGLSLRALLLNTICYIMEGVGMGLAVHAFASSKTWSIIMSINRVVI